MKIERVRFELDEIIMALVESHPTKRKQIHEALCSALDMLTGEILECAGNYLDMWDED